LRQYFVISNDLINKKFRVIGITLRGFGQSSRPYGLYDYDVHARDIKKVLAKLDIKNAVLGCFSVGGAIVIRYISKYKGAHVSKLALFSAAAPIWTQRKDFPYNLQKNVVDALVELNYKDQPKLLSDFAKIFSTTETSLNEEIGSCLNGICISASSYATAKCLIALSDTDP